MELQHSIIADLVKVICNHLSLDEDLFIAGEKQYRILEGRKYLYYLAVEHYKIPASVVKRYFGLGMRRTVESGAHIISTRLHLGKQMRYQVYLDITALKNKL